jgi:hypothetical protein
MPHFLSAESIMNLRIVVASSLFLMSTIAMPADEPRADQAMVESIVREIEAVPSHYARDEKPVKFESLPAFTAARLAQFTPDKDRSFEKQQADWKADRVGYAKEHPLRARIFEAIDIKTGKKLDLPKTIRPDFSPKDKLKLLQQQVEPGLALLDLEELLDDMAKDSEQHRANEKSLRWRADFDFARARTMSAYIFLFEYNYALAQIRSDSLPDLKEGQTGWKLVPSERLSVLETKVKVRAKECLKLLKGIQADYAGTPWAYFAERESQRPLGMRWVAKMN